MDYLDAVCCRAYDYGVGGLESRMVDMNNEREGSMKKMVLVLVLACVGSVYSDDVVHVSAGSDGNGGAEVRAGVDLFAFTQAGRARRAQRRAETRARRENMTAPEVVGDHLRHNWKKYAAAVTVVAVDRYAYNNSELYYKWLGIKSSSSGGGDRTGDDATVIVDISGNNNNVVIQIPAGSGSGMSGSAGAGGQGNSSESTTSTTGF